MKQLLTILLLFPLFIACSSDDDNNHGDTLEEQIVGTWVNTSIPAFNPANKLVFANNVVKGYDENNKLIIDSKYTVYTDVIKFEYFTATINNNILIVDGVDQQWKFKRQ